MASGDITSTRTNIEKYEGPSYVTKLEKWNDGGGKAITGMHIQYLEEWECLLVSAAEYDEICAKIRDHDAVEKMDLPAKATLMSEVALKGATLCNGIAKMGALVDWNAKIVKTLGKKKDDPNSKPELDWKDLKEEVENVCPTFRKPIDPYFCIDKTNITCSVVAKVKVWHNWIYEVFTNLTNSRTATHGWFLFYGKEEENGSETTVTIDVFVGARDKTRENEYKYSAGKATRKNDILAKAESSMLAYWTMADYEFEELCKKEIVDGIGYVPAYEEENANQE